MVTASVEETYTPYGNISRIFACKEPELIIAGPAGTGKSKGILEYLNYWAMSYPGCRLLMTRKTRRSLTESGMVTLEQKVLHPAQAVRFHSSKQQYQYPNGSIIAVGGLDKSSKIMSSEWDLIYCQEATELDENDWESCSIRLRNAKLPIQQLIGDVNPGPANHWIKQRSSQGRLLMMDTRHEDNPTLFNRDGTKTPDGERYLGKLDKLTGVRYARYRLGLWVSAEGMVWEQEWNPARNIINYFVPPIEWPRYLVVDFGYVHPFVCLWAAEDNDGRLYVYRQIYKTHTLVEDHAREIKRVSRWGEKGGDPLPRAIICDHQAEDRATLERHLGLMTIPAHKSVSDGIQAVASRFRDAGDGKPRLMIMRDTLVDRDKDLEDAKQPTETSEEIEGYIWDTRQGMKKGEQPLKERDDGCFVAGTMVTTNHGDVPIEKIKPGDRVLTRDGYMVVKASGMTNQHADVFTAWFSNGTSLTGTANHPVYLKGKGYIPLRSLRYGDIMVDINSYKERYLPLWQSLQQDQRPSFTRGLNSGVTRMRRTGQRKTTTDQVVALLSPESKRSIRKFGRMLMGLSLMDAISTTRMGIHQTTLLKILNVLQQKSMQITMQNSPFQKSAWKNYAKIWIMRELLLANGTNQKQVENGIKSLPLWHMLMLNTSPMLVSNVDVNFSQGICGQIMQNFALTIANQRLDENQASITRRAFANSAEKSTLAIDTLRKNSAPTPVWGKANKSVLRDCACNAENHSLSRQNSQRNIAQPHVLTITSINDKQDVYNLTVDNTVGEGEYFANGILVHNCDCIRYLCAYKDLKNDSVSYFKNPW